MPRPYNPQGDVETLMKAFNQEVKDKPELPNKETLLLRARLVFEEALEFVLACGMEVKLTPECVTEIASWDLVGEGNDTVFLNPEDLVVVESEEAVEADLEEYADACADQLVVTYGALSAAGIKADTLFDEVHRSNLSKIPSDGIILKREDGKVTKPTTFFKPDIANVLEKQSEPEMQEAE